MIKIEGVPAEQLAELTVNYEKIQVERCNELKIAFDALNKSPADEELRDAVKSLTHAMKGGGATYGYHLTTTIATDADELLATKETLDEADLQNLANHVDFEQIAKDSDIAYRSFQRRFKQATNYSPLQYLQYLRVQNAKELLQNTNLNIQDIAELIGYVDASHFARVFKKHTEQTPNNFRQAVRGKLFTA